MTKYDKIWVWLEMRRPVPVVVGEHFIVSFLPVRGLEVEVCGKEGGLRHIFEPVADFFRIFYLAKVFLNRNFGMRHKKKLM